MICNILIWSLRLEYFFVEVVQSLFLIFNIVIYFFWKFLYLFKNIIVFIFFFILNLILKLFLLLDYFLQFELSCLNVFLHYLFKTLVHVIPFLIVFNNFLEFSWVIDHFNQSVIFLLVLYHSFTIFVPFVINVFLVSLSF